MLPTFDIVNTTAFDSLASASPDCAPAGGMKIALAIISILLAASEFLSLNKKIPASGIVQGIVMAVTAKKDENSTQPLSETETRLRSLVNHARDGVTKILA